MSSREMDNWIDNFPDKQDELVLSFIEAFPTHPAVANLIDVVFNHYVENVPQNDEDPREDR